MLRSELKHESTSLMTQFANCLGKVSIKYSIIGGQYLLTQTKNGLHYLYDSQAVKIARFYAYGSIFVGRKLQLRLANDMANEWYELGQSYDDVVIKRLGCEKAITIYGYHTKSLYALSGYYGEGVGGVSVNTALKEDYLLRAADSGHPTARLEWLDFKYPPKTDWMKLAEKFKLCRQNENAYICTQKAYADNPDNLEALYFIAQAEAKGEGTTRNRDRAIMHFERALRQNYYEAAKELIILHNAPQNKEDADYWYKCAENYLASTESISNKKDLLMQQALVRACYEKCYSINPKHANTLYFLGLFHEFGFGHLKASDIEAKRHYKAAEKLGHFPAAMKFIQLEYPKNKSCVEWVRQAKVLIEKQSYHHAMLCLSLSIQINPIYAKAYYVIGTMFELGQGAKPDLATAIKYYEKADSDGVTYCLEARNALKKIRSDADTESLYKNVKAFSSWIFAIIAGTEKLVRHAAHSTITPAAKWLSGKTGEEWIETMTFFGIEAFCFISNPPAYLAYETISRGVTSIERILESKTEIRNHYTRVGMRLLADQTSSILYSWVKQGIDEAYKEKEARKKELALQEKNSKKADVGFNKYIFSKITQNTAATILPHGFDHIITPEPHLIEPDKPKKHAKEKADKERESDARKQAEANKKAEEAAKKAKEAQEKKPGSKEAEKAAKNADKAQKQKEKTDKQVDKNTSKRIKKDGLDNISSNYPKDSNFLCMVSSNSLGIFANHSSKKKDLGAIPTPPVPPGPWPGLGQNCSDIRTSRNKISESRVGIFASSQSDPEPIPISPPPEPDPVPTKKEDWPIYRSDEPSGEIDDSLYHPIYPR